MVTNLHLFLPTYFIPLTPIFSQSRFTLSTLYRVHVVVSFILASPIAPHRSCHLRRLVSLQAQLSVSPPALSSHSTDPHVVTLPPPSSLGLSSSPLGTSFLPFVILFFLDIVIHYLNQPIDSLCGAKGVLRALFPVASPYMTIPNSLFSRIVHFVCFTH